MRGAMNPHFGAEPKHCEYCQNEFYAYSKARKFCDLQCYRKSLFLKQIIPEPLQARNCDRNHPEIVAALTAAGVRVIDLSNRGSGIPDLLTIYQGRVSLLEVKNPRTFYGRKGFSGPQQRWANGWTGEPPIVVRSTREALDAATRPPCCGRSTIREVRDVRDVLQAIGAMRVDL